MNDVTQDYLTSGDSENRTVTFVPNPDETVTTVGATRVAYNLRQIERRYERVIEAKPNAGLMLEYTGPADDQLSLSGNWGSVYVTLLGIVLHFLVQKCKKTT